MKIHNRVRSNRNNITEPNITKRNKHYNSIINILIQKKSSRYITKVQSYEDEPLASSKMNKLVNFW